MEHFPYLNARDHCPPAFVVTRWFAPQPMRRTLVRAPGQSEEQFCQHAQELAHVWLSTGLMGPQLHPCLVTIECRYAVPRNPEHADDTWVSQQVLMQIVGDQKTTERVRRDALQVLRELSQHAEAA